MHAAFEDRQAENSDDLTTVLLVDDEPSVLKALRRVLIDEDYRLLTAPDASDAIEILERGPVELLITDHRMPGRSGAALLQEVSQRWPQTIRIMLTGQADPQAIMQVVEETGVFKFIFKPWNDDDLRLTVRLALRQYQLQEENRRLRQATLGQLQQLRDSTAIVSDNRRALGNLLERAELLSSDNLRSAQQDIRPGELFVETLRRLDLVGEDALVDCFCRQLQIGRVDAEQLDSDCELVDLLTLELCRSGLLWPFRIEGRLLHLAMVDPSCLTLCSRIEAISSYKVEPHAATLSTIQALLDARTGRHLQIESGERRLELAAETDALVPGHDDSPVALVDQLLAQAIKRQASDIHIEPKGENSRIRLRVDGLLEDGGSLPGALHNAVVSRLKILSRLDISEKRKPQDGRMAVVCGNSEIDVRVSCLPTISGEKVVMRLLDRHASILELADLGMLPRDLLRIERLLGQPQGILIATGPTGSGKTTLLYSLLHRMLQQSRNFQTIEDPVEYYLAEASQTYVKQAAGLSFASVLRATLRQDPDVILVGEIRDRETADIAFKAALTGHLVLTTLHTNSSVATLTRLVDMGVKPLLIASAVQGIIAQRLVRKLCPDCKQQVAADKKQLELLGLDPLDFTTGVWRGIGCPSCRGSGYKGRSGVFELMMLSEEICRQVAAGAGEADLQALARSEGMHSLIDDGAEKLRLGITSCDELLRVLGPQLRTQHGCPHCQKLIDSRFMFCPYCGGWKPDYCRSCQLPLEKGWAACPTCGTAVEARFVTRQKPSGHSET